MTLGQGSLKPTPWWCWATTFVAAAMLLPSAAFVAIAKDKHKVEPRSTKQGREQVDTEAEIPTGLIAASAPSEAQATSASSTAEKSESRSGRPMFGVGVNSDAGVFSTALIDENVQPALAASKRKSGPVASLQQLVDQFNELMEERRFDEAELVARQAWKLDPKDPVVQAMMWKSRFSLGPFGSSPPKTLPSPYCLDDVHTHRLEGLPDPTVCFSGEPTRSDSPEVDRIKKMLHQKIDVNYGRTPLHEFAEDIGRRAGVNVYLDRRGLEAEGITKDEPVTLKIERPIQARSALNLVLSPLHLKYVIEDEVVKITSEQSGIGTYSKAYNVTGLANTNTYGNLVIPFPKVVTHARSDHSPHRSERRRKSQQTVRLERLSLVAKRVDHRPSLRSGVLTTMSFVLAGSVTLNV